LFLSVVYFPTFVSSCFLFAYFFRSVICLHLSVLYFFLRAAYIFSWQLHSFDRSCAFRGRMARTERPVPRCTQEEWGDAVCIHWLRTLSSLASHHYTAQAE
jgi:hypothetical protein